MKHTVTLSEVVDFLNGLLDTDREAVSELFHLKVPCNQALADHPTVQCSSYILNESGASIPTPGKYRVGLLGILNGLFGIDDQGWGPIARCVELEDMKTIDKFALSEKYRNTRTDE